MKFIIVFLLAVTSSLAFSREVLWDECVALLHPKTASSNEACFKIKHTLSIDCLQAAGSKSQQTIITCAQITNPYALGCVLLSDKSDASIDACAAIKTESAYKCVRGSVEDGKIETSACAKGIYVKKSSNDCVSCTHDQQATTNKKIIEYITSIDKQHQEMFRSLPNFESADGKEFLKKSPAAQEQRMGCELEMAAVKIQTLQIKDASMIPSTLPALQACYRIMDDWIKHKRIKGIEEKWPKKN